MGLSITWGDVDWGMGGGGVGHSQIYQESPCVKSGRKKSARLITIIVSADLKYVFFT
jgi:hypothetical protein